MKRLAALAGVCLLLATKPAAARAPIVVIVEQDSPDEVVTEALTRIKGELIATGCEVIQVAARDLATTPAIRVELAATAVHAIAAFEIVHDAEHPLIEIWIADRLSGKPVVRRIDVPPESETTPTSALAVHAVELLHASLLERLVTVAVQEDAKQPTAPSAPAHVVAPGVPRVELEIGPAMAVMTADSRPDWQGVTRLGYRLSSTFAVRASFAGLDLGTSVTNDVGTASLHQAQALVDLTAGHTWGVLRPYASAGVGAHHLAVETSARMGYLGRDERFYSALAGAGIGASVAFNQRFFASLESDAAFIAPSPLVRFAGVDGARLGRPLLSVAFTLGARL